MNKNYKFRNFAFDVLIFGILLAINNVFGVLWMIWIGIRTYQRTTA